MCARTRTETTVTARLPPTRGYTKISYLRSRKKGNYKHVWPDTQFQVRVMVHMRVWCLAARCTCIVRIGSFMATQADLCRYIPKHFLEQHAVCIKCSNFGNRGFYDRVWRKESLLATEGGLQTQTPHYLKWWHAPPLLSAPIFEHHRDWREDQL